MNDARKRKVRPSNTPDIAITDDDYVTWLRNRAIHLYIDKAGNVSDTPDDIITSLQNYTAQAAVQQAYSSEPPTENESLSSKMTVQSTLIVQKPSSSSVGFKPSSAAVQNSLPAIAIRPSTSQVDVIFIPIRGPPSSATMVCSKPSSNAVGQKQSSVTVGMQPSSAQIDMKLSSAQIDTKPSSAQIDMKLSSTRIDFKRSFIAIGGESFGDSLNPTSSVPVEDNLVNVMAALQQCLDDTPNHLELGVEDIAAIDDFLTQEEAAALKREESLHEVTTGLEFSTKGPSDTERLFGPDRLAMAADYITWESDKPVKLYITATGPGSEKPISVMTALHQTVQRSPFIPALVFKQKEKWARYTYQIYSDMIHQAARAFIRLGLKQHCGVGIMGFNAPQWFIADMAAIFAGGLAVGIYTTNSSEVCRYVAHSTACNIIVVENDQLLQKILTVRDRLPHLKAIVQYSDTLTADFPNVYTWDEMMAFGFKFETPEALALDAELEIRIRSQAPNHCCTIVFTSGTTGNPKGVMLSHDNLIWTANAIAQVVNLTFNEESIVSYLPLSHITGQLIDIFISMLCGATVYFVQHDALQISLIETLKDIHPTLFVGVPSIWEKMRQEIVLANRINGCCQQKIYTWAKEVGYKGNTARLKGNKPPGCFCLARRLVFDKVRSRLGLDNCRLCVSCAAPIMKDTLNFFLSINIQVLEVYGMCESTGPHSMSYRENYTLGSVGRALPGTRTYLSQPEPDGSGEICMQGRHIFMGYINMPEKTRETVDEQGWLFSGDIGQQASNGFLYVTGRMKELIITATGENIAPVLIEETVKQSMPCISNCMLIGDNRQFLTMLLTLKTEIDSVTMEPTDKLSPTAIFWCESVGSKSTKVSEILQGPDMAVMYAIQEGIDNLATIASSRSHLIHKWAILPRDFSIAGGELGSTMKVKRAVVNAKYATTIDALYRSSSEEQRQPAPPSTRR